MTKDDRRRRRATQNEQAKRRQLADLEHKAELTAQAAADLRAKLADEGVDVQAPVPEAEPAPADEKMMDDDIAYQPYRPYGGVTTLKDALAAMDAEKRAWAVQRAAWLFQDITGNILADENIADKGKAIAAAAREFQDLLDDPKPLMKAKPDKEDPTPPEDPAAQLPAPGGKPTPAMPMPAGGAISHQAFLGYLAMLGSGSAQKSGAMVVFKEADGAHRWFGWVTNKWRDRDIGKHPKGEILTDAAHKEFMGWLDEHPDQAPELWSWHTPGSARKARADWWDYVDGFVVMSGPLTADEAKGYSGDAELIGMSHGFRVLARNSAAGLIEKYRTFEASDLPLDVAANPFTAFDVIRKELDAMPFSKDKRDYLVKRLGEERVAQLEANTGEMAKTLEALGVESKEATPDPSAAAPAAAPVPAAPAAAPDQIGPDEADLAKSFEQLKGLLNVGELQAYLADLKSKADQLPALQQELAQLKAQVTGLKKSDDEKLAEQIAPKIKPISWGFQASAADASKLTEAEKGTLGQQQPSQKGAKGTGWFHDVMGVS